MHVQFRFGDSVLKGEVVATEPGGDVTGPETTLVVETEAGRYRTAASETLPAR